MIGCVSALCMLLGGMSPIPDYVPEPVPCPSEPLIGCYYFPGHFRPARWTPMREAGFPVPILGCYRDGEPEVLDWHIKWAVEHGIDFFAFDYYHHYKSGPSGEHNGALNEGFLRARYRGLMKFCMMWCNESKDERYTEERLLEFARIVTERFFSQPNHLRIEGDNVLIFSVPQYLIQSFGVEGTARVLQKMSDISKKAGHGGLFPVSKGHADQQQLKAAGFRAITAYNYPTAGMSPEELKAKRAPYSQMVEGMEAIWKEVTEEGVLPYFVPVSPGWDSRPWYGENALVRTHSSPGAYYEMCVAAKKYVNPDLPIIIAECWNEFGEGSYVEPTERYGFGYLDAMRDAFCPDNPHHDDATPEGIGRPAPIFPNIPQRAQALMEAGANMLFNGDMEDDWGWGLYRGPKPPWNTNAHGGKRCLVVPSGEGVKSHWTMPIPDSRKVQLTLWYRTPAGASLSVKAALFEGIRWLGRYKEIGNLPATDGAWRQFSAPVTIDDTDATKFDLEFVAAGADCHVDDIDIRKADGAP